MKKPVIAIDGYSSTGKSSISKIIADKLGLIHMDTGALYRGVTWYALQHCLNENGEIDLNTLFSSFDQIQLEFKNNDGTLVLFLNNTDISKEIRTNIVSDNVSLVAKQKEVEIFYCSLSALWQIKAALLWMDVT
jgi:cytidylate kinase